MTVLSVQASQTELKETQARTHHKSADTLNTSTNRSVSVLLWPAGSSVCVCVCVCVRVSECGVFW